MLRDGFSQKVGRMKIIEKRSVIIIKESSERIIVTDHLEATLQFFKLYTFLWFREGLFCIIPDEIIRNAVDILNAWAKSDLKTMPPDIFFTWDQGIPVDPRVGYALLGKQGNNQP